jgi:hypothetical protein
LEELAGIDSVQYAVYDEQDNFVIGNVDIKNTEIMSLINMTSNLHNLQNYQNSRYQVNSISIGALRGRIITIVDKSILLRPLKQSIIYSGLILSFAIVILILLFYIAVRDVINPIYKITVFIQNMHNDNIK